MAAEIRNPGPPLSREQLNEIERRLGVTLPTEYASFLLTFNGGDPAPGWIHFGDGDGDYAEVTQFWSAEMMASETQSLREYLEGFNNHLGSEEDALVISVSPQNHGVVFWNASTETFEPSDLTRVADSFTALLDRLDYVEDTKPWMMLIDNNDLDGLRRWLDTGGNPLAKEDTVIGFSALEWAQSWERHDMVALLMSRGAKPRKPWWKFW
jgi:hypothetical protein